MDDAVREARRIFVQNNVKEAMSYMSTISRNVDESRDTLKALIGNSFTDIIKSCDRVVDISATSTELISLKECLQRPLAGLSESTSDDERSEVVSDYISRYLGVQDVAPCEADSAAARAGSDDASVNTAADLLEVREDLLLVEGHIELGDLSCAAWTMRETGVKLASLDRALALRVAAHRVEGSSGGRSGSARGCAADDGSDTARAQSEVRRLRALLEAYELRVLFGYRDLMRATLRPVVQATADYHHRHLRHPSGSHGHGGDDTADDYNDEQDGDSGEAARLMASEDTLNEEMQRLFAQCIDALRHLRLPTNVVRDACLSPLLLRTDGGAGEDDEHDEEGKWCRRILRAVQREGSVEFEEDVGREGRSEVWVRQLLLVALSLCADHIAALCGDSASRSGRCLGEASGAGDAACATAETRCAGDASSSMGVMERVCEVGYLFHHLAEFVQAVTERGSCDVLSAHACAAEGPTVTYDLSRVDDLQSLLSQAQQMRLHQEKCGSAEQRPSSFLARVRMITNTRRFVPTGCDEGRAVVVSPAASAATTSSRAPACAPMSSSAARQTAELLRALQRDVYAPYVYVALSRHCQDPIALTSYHHFSSLAAREGGRMRGSEAGGNGEGNDARMMKALEKEVHLRRRDNDNHDLRNGEAEVWTGSSPITAELSTTRYGTLLQRYAIDAAVSSGLHDMLKTALSRVAHTQSILMEYIPLVTRYVTTEYALLSRARHDDGTSDVNEEGEPKADLYTWQDASYRVLRLSMHFGKLLSYYVARSSSGANGGDDTDVECGTQRAGGVHVKGVGARTSGPSGRGASRPRAGDTGADPLALFSSLARQKCSSGAAPWSPTSRLLMDDYELVRASSAMEAGLPCSLHSSSSNRDAHGGGGTHSYPRRGKKTVYGRNDDHLSRTWKDALRHMYDAHHASSNNTNDTRGGRVFLLNDNKHEWWCGVRLFARHRADACGGDEKEDDNVKGVTDLLPHLGEPHLTQSHAPPAQTTDNSSEWLSEDMTSMRADIDALWVQLARALRRPCRTRATPRLSGPHEGTRAWSDMLHCLTQTLQDMTVCRMRYTSHAPVADEVRAVWQNWLVAAAQSLEARVSETLKAHQQSRMTWMMMMRGQEESRRDTTDGSRAMSEDLSVSAAHAERTGAAAVKTTKDDAVDRIAVMSTALQLVQLAPLADALANAAAAASSFLSNSSSHHTVGAKDGTGNEMNNTNTSREDGAPVRNAHDWVSRMRALSRMCHRPWQDMLQSEYREAFALIYRRTAHALQGALSHRPHTPYSSSSSLARSADKEGAVVTLSDVRALYVLMHSRSFAVCSNSSSNGAVCEKKLPNAHTDTSPMPPPPSSSASLLSDSSSLSAPPTHSDGSLDASCPDSDYPHQLSSMLLELLYSVQVLLQHLTRHAPCASCPHTGGEGQSTLQRSLTSENEQRLVAHRSNENGRNASSSTRGEGVQGNNHGLYDTSRPCAAQEASSSSRCRSGMAEAVSAVYRQLLDISCDELIDTVIPTLSGVRVESIHNGITTATTTDDHNNSNMDCIHTHGIDRAVAWRHNDRASDASNTQSVSLRRVTACWLQVYLDACVVGRVWTHMTDFVSDREAPQEGRMDRVLREHVMPLVTSASAASSSSSTSSSSSNPMTAAHVHAVLTAAADALLSRVALVLGLPRRAPCTVNAADNVARRADCDDTTTMTSDQVGHDRRTDSSALLAASAPSLWACRRREVPRFVLLPLPAPPTLARSMMSDAYASPSHVTPASVISEERRCV